MEKYLTVRFFKRVITFTVLAVILALTVTVTVLSVKLYGLTHAAYGTDGETERTLQTDAMEYQEKYPHLQIEGDIVQKEDVPKTVYLTFDDGPSLNNTVKILDTLKEENIKATFFLVGKITEEKKPVVQRMIDEGHTIGIHTYSHDYEKIYKSVENYLADFEKLWNQLYEEFGYKAEVYRFPGGSVNNYNFTVCGDIIAEMYRRGFVYYDWNASAEDASASRPSADRIKNSIVGNVRRNQGKSIVLMHDSSGMTATAEAVPNIISTLKKDGYTFDKLDRSVKPVSFSYLK